MKNKQLNRVALLIGGVLLSILFIQAVSPSSNDQDQHDYSGHDHSGHDHSGHDHSGHDHSGHDHSGHDHSGHDHSGHDHSGHDHSGHDHSDIKPNECEVPKESQFLLGVQTRLTKSSKKTLVSKLMGTVRSHTNGSVSINSPQNATVRKIHVNIGERVKKGQVLVSMTQNIGSMDKLQIKAELKNMEGELAKFEAEKVRLEGVQDLVAKKRLEEVELEIAKLSNLISAYRSALSGGTSSFTITAPIHGVVEDFELSNGQQVSESDLLLSIHNSQLVKVEAIVYPREMSALSDSVAYAIRDLATGNLIEQGITNAVINPTIDEQSQTGTLILSITNGDQMLRPGQQVSVEITKELAEDVISVPTEAIIEHQGIPVVFVHTQPERFEFIPVNPGVRGTKYTQIIDGLEPGLRVVTKSAHRVHAIYMSK